MRSCSVSVRLAASLLAVAAASGCMSVGDDGAGAGVKPSPSAGRPGGEAPEGGKAGSGRYVSGTTRDGDGKGAHEEHADDAGGPSASPSASAQASPGASPSVPGSRPGPGPGPVKPTPSRSAVPEPPQQSPSPEPPAESPTPSPSPSQAEPSPSAQEPAPS